MKCAKILNMTWKRHGRLARIGILHLAIVALSISCDGRRFYDIESGEVVLKVPRPDGSWVKFSGVEFSLEDEVSDGALMGWVQADGCQVTVSICDDGACAMAFRAIVPPGKEVYFEETSWDNDVLDHYINKFDGASQPLCSCAGPREDRHTLGLRLESDLCPARLEALVGLDLIEEEEYY